jgi:hypothetical protein
VNQLRSVTQAARATDHPHRKTPARVRRIASTRFARRRSSMMKYALATTMFMALALSAGGAAAQTPGYVAPSSTPTWQYNGASGQRSKAIADTYTRALNDLYAHGFHRVHHLLMQGGLVYATAISPHDVQRTVTVDPGSGQISMG